MDNNITLHSRKVESWACLIIEALIGISAFIEAIKLDSIGLSLSGCGFLLLGVVEFRHPISFTKPLRKLFHNDGAKMDSKTEILFLISMVLIFIGMIFYHVFDL
jgi:hypothetical protein